jgi:molybdopterin/thiamine biosynthesis adenylyltransferase
MEKRYARNLGMFSEEEMSTLLTKQVAVIGCGGLGGFIIEMMARLGVKKLLVVDSDVFDETNLNRQLLSDEASMGLSKALQAKKRVALINSSVDVVAVEERLSLDNGGSILTGCDVLLDAVDNIGTRFMLQQLAEELEIPMIHGAIAGWYGQVSTLFPGDRTMGVIYPHGEENDKGIEVQLGNPSFTPALIASIQVAEAVKVLIGRGEVLRKTLLYIDTLHQEYEKVQLD